MLDQKADTKEYRLCVSDPPTPPNRIALPQVRTGLPAEGVGTGQVIGGLPLLLSLAGCGYIGVFKLGKFIQLF